VSSQAPQSSAWVGRGLDQAYSQSFVWPLRGELTVPYGGQEESVAIKGIVIQGKEGENVVAAQDGRVSFVDEKLKGYGKTIILEHTQDLSTVYARNSEILVTPGQRVRQGEPIARVGRAGRGSVPQLYFEVRRKARPENPAQYLR
jgi:septal ring factor EnvC (AmiA/AmiB activator)